MDKKNQSVLKKKGGSILKVLKKIRWSLIFLVVFWLGVITTGSIVAYFGYNIWLDTEAFDVTRLYSSEASQILDSEGNVIYKYGSDENGERENVEYDELPQVLIDAIVATEDSRYFEHNGFDVPRTARAAITNILTMSTSGGGGSTITQQVIKKSYFPAAEQTITRKVSELFLALNASEEVSKEEILTMYLNKIYFGRSLSSIGVKAASNYYFNKDVQDLTLPEAALLAGTLNAPHTYDPYYNLDLATQRRNTVLALMETHGYISNEEKELAQAIKIENTLDYNYKDSNSNTALAYIDVVNSEVIEKTGLDPREETMIIHTFLDSAMQAEITEIITDFNFPNDDMQVGSSVQNVHNGQIVAVVGGRDYGAFNLNRSTIKQQPGSSLKPIVDYGAGFEFLDWSTAHTVTDEEYNVAGYNPANWDGTIGTKGDMSISTALVNSWNTPAVWTFDSVLEKIGYSGYTDYFEGFKIDMSQEEMNIAYSIGGWSTGASPIELANMYAAVANGGTAYESHTINYIEILSSNETVNVDEVIQEEASRAMSAETSFMIEDVMESYCRTSSYSYMPSSFRSKSGTTNWGENNYGITVGSGKDSLFCSYNPDYSMALWLGYDHSTLLETPRVMNTYGVLTAQLAGKIGYAIVEDGVENSFASAPSSLSTGKAVMGYYPYVLPSSDTPSSKILSGWFKSGTLPTKTIDEFVAPTLESFTATANSSNTKINVTFAQYDPIEALEDANESDITKMFGLATYVVEIRDYDTNELLHTTSLNKDTASISFDIDRRINVIGYYGYEDSTSITSNKITIVLGEEFAPEEVPTLDEIQSSILVNGSEAINNQTVLPGSTITVNVTPQNEGNTIVITLFNEDTSEVIQLITSQSASFTVSNSGSYSIKITESDLIDTITKTYAFTVSSDDEETE